MTFEGKSILFLTSWSLFLQKSTVSCPRNRCQTAGTTTYRPATTWCPSRCSPLRISQKCSVARTSSPFHDLLFLQSPPAEKPSFPSLHTPSPLSYHFLKTALVQRRSCTLGLEHRCCVSKPQISKGLPPALWTNVLFSFFFFWHGRLFFYCKILIISCADLHRHVLIYCFVFLCEQCEDCSCRCLA